MAQLLAAASIVGGVVGFVVWLVVHNVRYTQRDLALKAAQLASNVTVRKDQVLELLMQYTYDATRQRVGLESVSAVCSPVPHIRATTMDGSNEVIFVPDDRDLVQHIENGRGHGRRCLLTVRNAGLLAAEKMRQVWSLLAKESGLLPAERVLPYAEAWAVFLVERRFPI